MSENLSLSYCSFKSDRINLLEPENIFNSCSTYLFCAAEKGYRCLFWRMVKNTELEMQLLKISPRALTSKPQNRHALKNLNFKILKIFNFEARNKMNYNCNLRLWELLQLEFFVSLLHVFSILQIFLMQFQIRLRVIFGNRLHWVLVFTLNRWLESGRPLK